MMGTKERSFAPLCNRSLETLVPVDHFYRHLDAKLDFRFVRELVCETYRAGGRGASSRTSPRSERYERQVRSVG